MKRWSDYTSFQFFFFYLISLRDRTVTNAMTLRLFTAKFQGWAIQENSLKMFFLASEIWNCIQYSSRICTNSAFILTAKISFPKAGHRSSCISISHHMWVYGRSSPWRKHSKGHFGHLWKLLLGWAAVKVPWRHYLHSVDGIQECLTKLKLALLYNCPAWHNFFMSCKTFMQLKSLFIIKWTYKQAPLLNINTKYFPSFETHWINKKHHILGISWYPSLQCTYL
jgi:hypothetical protein